MIKLFTTTILLVSIFTATTVFAQEAVFSSVIRSSYSLTQGDNTGAQVIHQVTINSHDDRFYPTNFAIGVETDKLQNLSAQMPNQQLVIDGTTVLLPEPTSQSPQTIFDIHYDSANLVKKKGNLKIVTIPIFRSNSNLDIDQLAIEVVVPSAWGDVSMTTFPLQTSQIVDKEQRLYFQVDLTSSEESKIPGQELQLVFGGKQLYDVFLVYQIQNTDPDNEAVHTVAFPPDFSGLQQVFVERIEPLPDSVTYDSDGNVLGDYILDPGETQEVVFRGQVLIQPDYFEAQSNDLALSKLGNAPRYLIPDQYWDVYADEIQVLAQELQTPEAIYTYVTQKLKYNQDKVAKLEIERAGALGALREPEDAACMEFTDLTVALMRAAGIPAREVDGYAYLEDDEILVRPIVTDVLHAWVQYWKEGAGWVNIDPTWGASTGRDYFNRFDHDHLIFVMKGISSTYPYPAGAYRLDDLNTQNVRVSLSQNTEPQYQTFENWIRDFQNEQHKSWWVKLWEWLINLFK